MQLSPLFFLYGLIAVDKITFGVLSPPTGLECEASTRKEKHNHEGGKEKKRQKRKEKNIYAKCNIDSIFQSCYFEITKYFCPEAQLNRFDRLKLIKPISFNVLIISSLSLVNTVAVLNSILSSLCFTTGYT